MLDEDKNASNRNLRKFTIINCNARSLCPKIESFIDCFNEMDAAIGVVSETWLSPETAKDVQDRLSEESGIGLITGEHNGRPITESTMAESVSGRINSNGPRHHVAIQSF